ncbi:DUF3440 domain-containing protein [uncultured Tessaracoccus sp.]|uniref:DUF3440 domain-containing protein n=1 Tax=uncultured Tessaracoccus sp. TaxID=905023 RepID=UPI00260B8425|nr:DUF3440 domain-containing protein [uncultured Tessaracoccus sp.]
MDTMNPSYTVLDAARDRIRRIFEDFDNIIVAFSGGKDSGVMLNLVYEHIRNHAPERRVTVFHMDYEGQYTATTEYVDRIYAELPEFADPLRICLPFAASTSVSMTQTYWQPWNPDEQDIWVRPMPDHAGVNNADNVPEDFPEYEAVEDYKLQARIGRWLHQKSGAKRTAVLVGIREEESLHRYAAINREDKDAMHDGLRWTSKIFADVYNAYPIHDWLVSDVWTANARFGWDYNKLYDLFHMAGLKPSQMRVASPFLSAGLENLKLYRVVEPEMWAKLVGRVNGANFGAIYGGTSAMGAKSVKLPPGHTWHSYAEFLLSTLPKATRDGYLKKMATSIKYWTEKGGAVKAETAEELRKLGLDIQFSEPTRSYNTPHEVALFAEYPDDLDVSDFAAVPTWKRLVVTILKNDHACKYMGFGPTKDQYERRAAALEKYKNLL